MSTRQPDVVMLTNALAPDKLGGLERYVRELAAALVRAGTGVTVLTKRMDPGPPDEVVESDGVRVVRHSVPSKSRPGFAVEYPLAVSRAVRAELARRPGAVVHGHYAITTLAATAARTPYLYTFHAPVHKEVLFQREGSYLLPRPVQRAAVAGLRTAEAQVVRRADRVFVLSEFMGDEVRELDPAGPAPVLLPGGIDTAHFSPAASARDAWAAAAQPLLFTARRFNARTGVRELVEAMSVVRTHLPGARLAVAGDGATKDELEALRSRLGLDEQVRFLGRVSDDELLAWYRAADLTVMPTQELEGFGLTTAESLACGTPVLVTPVGANAELVRDLHPALVATGRSPRDLADSLVRLVRDRDLLADLRTRARAHVEPRWSWDSIARTYLEAYREQAERGPRR